MDEATTASAVITNDGELAALLRTQPAVGIAALYDRYGRLVFSMALRIVRDRGAAEEITQDVFMRCWRNLDRYQPSQGSLVSWLLSIAHNRAIDELRSRRGKNVRREISDDELLPQAAIDPGFDEALLPSNCTYRSARSTPGCGWGWISCARLCDACLSKNRFFFVLCSYII